MAKVVPGNLQLDYEIENLVSRIGADSNPRKYITKYSIDRDVNGPTIVTVQFIADEQFSKVVTTEKETDNG